MPAETRELWANPGSYLPTWDERARLAAQLVKPGSSVLDLGCGPIQPLRALLPSGCRYVPADLIRWSEEVIQVDLNAGELPQGCFDYIVMLGVLEYLDDVPTVLHRLRTISDNLVVSYCHPTRFANIAKRRALHWINDFRKRAFLRILVDAGWRPQGQTVYKRRGGMVQIVHEASA